MAFQSLMKVADHNLLSMVSSHRIVATTSIHHMGFILVVRKGFKRMDFAIVGHKVIHKVTIAYPTTFACQVVATTFLVVMLTYLVTIVAFHLTAVKPDQFITQTMFGPVADRIDQVTAID